MNRQHRVEKLSDVSNMEGQTLGSDYPGSKELKKKIVGLLNCYPNGLDIEKFSAAFLRRYGKPLVVSDWGFADIVDFINSWRGNVLKMVEKNGQQILYKHESVADMEVNAPKGVIIPDEVIDTFKSILRDQQGGIPLENVIGEYEMKTYRQFILSEFGFSSMHDFLSKLSETFKVSKRGDHFILSDPSAQEVQAFDLMSTDLDSPGLLRTFSSETRERLITLLQEEFPDGLTLEELDGAYKGFFGASLDDLNPSLYGYQSLTGLLRKHPDIVQMNYCHGSVILHSSQHQFNEEVLFSSFLPVKRVDYGSIFKSIDRKTMFPVGEMTEVVVGEVFSPSRFWIIHRGPNTSRALDLLMDRMCEFYSSRVGERYKVSLDDITIGAPVAAFISQDQNFYRALITSIEDITTVKLFLVDYGTVCQCNYSCLRQLHQYFFSLPAQAVKAAIDEIVPVKGRRLWPKSASERFLMMVQNKALVAHVTAIEDNVYMDLWDTSSRADISIMNLLVVEGQAEHKSEKSVNCMPSSLETNLSNSVQGTATTSQQQTNIITHERSNCEGVVQPNVSSFQTSEVVKNELQTSISRGVCSTHPVKSPDLKYVQPPPGFERFFNCPPPATASQTEHCLSRESGPSAGINPNLRNQKEEQKSEVTRESNEVELVQLMPHCGLHLLHLYEKPYVLGKDISRILQNVDNLDNILNDKSLNISKIVIGKSSDKELYIQLHRLGSTAIVDETLCELQPFLSAYLLEDVPKILKLFGFNDDIVIEAIKNLIAKYSRKETMCGNTDGSFVTQKHVGAISASRNLDIPSSLNPESNQHINRNEFVQTSPSTLGKHSTICSPSISGLYSMRSTGNSPSSGNDNANLNKFHPIGNSLEFIQLAAYVNQDKTFPAVFNSNTQFASEYPKSGDFHMKAIQDVSVRKELDSAHQNSDYLLSSCNPSYLTSSAGELKSLSKVSENMAHLSCNVTPSKDIDSRHFMQHMLEETTNVCSNDMKASRINRNISPYTSDFPNTRPVSQGDYYKMNPEYVDSKPETHPFYNSGVLSNATSCHLPSGSTVNYARIEGKTEVTDDRNPEVDNSQKLKAVRNPRWLKETLPLTGLRRPKIYGSMSVSSSLMPSDVVSALPTDVLAPEKNKEHLKAIASDTIKSGLPYLSVDHSDQSKTVRIRVPSREGQCIDNSKIIIDKNSNEVENLNFLGLRPSEQQGGLIQETRILLDKPAGKCEDCRISSDLLQLSFETNRMSRLDATTNFLPDQYSLSHSILTRNKSLLENDKTDDRSGLEKKMLTLGVREGNGRSLVSPDKSRKEAVGYTVETEERHCEDGEFFRHQDDTQNFRPPSGFTSRQPIQNDSESRMSPVRSGHFFEKDPPMYQGTAMNEESHHEEPPKQHSLTNVEQASSKPDEYFDLEIYDSCESIKEYCQVVLTETSINLPKPKMSEASEDSMLSNIKKKDEDSDQKGNGADVDKLSSQKVVIEMLMKELNIIDMTIQLKKHHYKWMEGQFASDSHSIQVLCEEILQLKEKYKEKKTLIKNLARNINSEEWFILMNNEPLDEHTLNIMLDQDQRSPSGVFGQSSPCSESMQSIISAHGDVLSNALFDDQGILLTASSGDRSSLYQSANSGVSSPDPNTPLDAVSSDCEDFRHLLDQTLTRDCGSLPNQSNSFPCNERAERNAEVHDQRTLTHALQVEDPSVENRSPTSVENRLPHSECVSNIDSIQDAGVPHQISSNKDSVQGAGVPHQTSSNKDSIQGAGVPHQTSSNKDSIQGAGVPHQTRSNKDSIQGAGVPHQTSSNKDSIQGAGVPHQTRSNKDSIQGAGVHHQTSSCMSKGLHGYIDTKTNLPANIGTQSSKSSQGKTNKGQNAFSGTLKSNVPTSNIQQNAVSGTLQSNVPTSSSSLIQQPLQYALPNRSNSGGEDRSRSSLPPPPGFVSSNPWPVVMQENFGYVAPQYGHQVSCPYRVNYNSPVNFPASAFSLPTDYYENIWTPLNYHGNMLHTSLNNNNDIGEMYYPSSYPVKYYNSFYPPRNSY